MIPIFIPTYGRASRQNTYNNLSPTLKTYAWLVVQQREAHLYDPLITIVLPARVKTIAATREYIVFHIGVKYEKLVMLDDDLRFCTRREDDTAKFNIATSYDQAAMFLEIETALNSYAHVGLLAREGGNRNVKNLECSRMMRVLAYHLPTMRRMQPSFMARGPRYTLEDFDVTLQLLRAGYKNLVLSGWVHDQSGSNTEGGCASYRTLELHNRNAAKLAKAHPQFVKLVTKTTKTAWGGATRQDVIVQWKKAYLSSGKGL